MLKKDGILEAGDMVVLAGGASRLTEQEKVIGEKTIGQYIPFYFGPRSPMLYVVQHGYNGVRQYDAENLVCLIWIVL